MSKRTIWALVAGAIILWVVATYGLPSHPICEGANPGQQECASYGLPRFLLLKFAGFIEANEGLFTVATGIAIAAFTYTLWRATDRLWTAGEKQLAHSEDTAKRQLRAYMGISDYEIKALGENFEDPNDGVIMIAMQNFGETPAIGVTSVISVGYADWNKEPEKPKKWAWTGKKLPIDVSPGAPMHRQISFAKHGFEYYFELLSGETAIYVEVKASYADIYGRRHDQTTCFYSQGIAYKSGIMQVLSQTREKTTEPREEK